jgi:predicted DNA-binding protein with PD1-like motif
MSDRIDVVAAGAGRLLVGRLLPGVDLIGGLEQACAAHSVRFAAVVACYGSLSRASFRILQLPPGESRPRLIDHRVDARVEFMGGQGLVCEDGDGRRATHLHGSVSDATGVVSGGHFVAAENPVYNNMDFVLQELVGVRLVREHDPETDTVEMRLFADETVPPTP